MRSAAFSFSFLFPALLVTFASSAQFKPDEIGHVSDPKFLQHIKTRGYQLVGAFEQARPDKGKTMYFAKVMKDGKWFFIDNDGKEYADENAVRNALGYNSREPFTERNWSSADAEIIEKPSMPYRQESYNYDRSTSGVFYDGKKAGYRFRGKAVVPAVYDSIYVLLYADQPFIKVISNGVQGVADTTGKLLIPVEFENIDRIVYSDMKTAYYSVKKNGKHGMLDENGKTVIPMQQYELRYRGNFFELTERTGSTQKAGAMDTLGRIIIPVAYRYIRPQEHSEVLFVSNGKRGKEERIGAYDLSGNLLFDTLYAKQSWFSENISKIEKTGDDGSAIGLFDLKQKKFLLEVAYQFDDMLTDTLTISREVNGKRLFGIINRNGEWVIPLKYEALDVVRGKQHLIAVLDGKSGLIDMHEKVIVPFQYERMAALTNFIYASQLPQDLFIVKAKGSSGMVNLKNEVVIPLKYRSLSPTNGGIAAESENGTEVLDLKGTVMLISQLHMPRFSKGILEGKIGQGKYIRSDLYGNEVID